MAFDLNGLNPIGEVGCDFRQRGRIWVPLWDYVSILVPSLTEEQIFMGKFNDGVAISKEQAEAIADVIEAHLESGQLAKHAAEFNDRMEREFPSSPCKSCAGTGVGKPPMALPPNGSCIICRGAGSKKPPRPEFNLESAEYFVAFCRNSGGFEIH